MTCLTQEPQKKFQSIQSVMESFTHQMDGM